LVVIERTNMLRWLIDGEHPVESVGCTCRGEPEVMESRLLMSVTAISRIVGPNRYPQVEGEGEEIPAWWD